MDAAWVWYPNIYGSKQLRVRASNSSNKSLYSSNLQPRVIASRLMILDFRITQFGSKVPTQNPTQPGSGSNFINPDPTRTQYWGPSKTQFGPNWTQLLHNSNHKAAQSSKYHTVFYISSGSYLESLCFSRTNHLKN